MATQMAHFATANGMNQSPFHSRLANGPGTGMQGMPNNPFPGATGMPRFSASGEPVRPIIPPGRHMFHPFNRPYPKPGQDRSDYDSKQLRKSSMRKTVDYYSSVIRMLETRVWQRDYRDRRALQPDVCYYPELVPPSCYLDEPSNAITTRFTKVATNKIRCPVFCLTWTPEGRRLITGASSGEFTLWNGLTFNFETILQAHDSPVRSMVWSHNDIWMVTGDHSGYIKYWQSNMNNVKMFQAHKEPIRGISFSPTDQKLASCSDDGTVRIWDFVRCQEEKILRGHGADVKCVDWHPQKGLVISGSKDNQQPVKLWDPKSGQSLATLHAHKSTVMDAKWNKNGQWLITASRDHLIKLFDIRRLDQELQTFRGHKKEASCLSWHPFHEELFCSGGSDGAIFFWNVGADKEVGAIDQAHESLIWSLAWHPIGHILCSGSNDHTSKFWTRNRPGDKMRDKYNLNTLPPGVMPEDAELLDDHHAPNIPGMGPEDKVDADGVDKQQESNITLAVGMIPGLDVEPAAQETKPTKKVPYAKPIPRNFQAQWNESPAKKQPILPTPERERAPGVSSDEEDHRDSDYETERRPSKGRKLDERESKADGKNSGSYNRDRELDDDDSYPRSRTPNLDDAPGYNRGPPGIGPTPTGGLLGDFPRGRGPQQQPVRHPLAPGQGGAQHHPPDQQYGWQGQPPQEMGNWDRPPFEPQHPDRFGPRGPPRPPHSHGQGGPPGPPGPPGPMNRPFFPPSHPHGDRFGPPHGDRFGPPHPQGPPRGRGPPQGHTSGWGGGPPMDNEEDIHYMPNGGGGGGGGPSPMDEEMPRHMMDGGYHDGGNYGWGPGQGLPNNFRGPQFQDGLPSFRGGPGFRGPPGPGPEGPYERGEEDYGSRGPPSGQYHHQGQYQQGPPSRWNQEGGRGGFNRGGGAGRRGGRRGGYNNY